MTFPKRVKIVEVGPRDGLQNETNLIPTNKKIELINKLSETGLKTIEATSFVSKKWIPQLHDAYEVYTSINKHPDISYPVLVPNIQGLTRALEAKVEHIALFTSASNTFCQKNINCTIKESFTKMEQLMKNAKGNNLKVRGYISCVLGCPYEKTIDPKVVANIAYEMKNLGCSEISLGDTIGIGTPLKSCHLIEHVAKKINIDNIAMHFHNTFGQALANIYACLNLGINIFDSSVAGLGGCPYAKGACGNVATEEVIYLLSGLNIETGVNLKKLLDVGEYVNTIIGCCSRSKITLENTEKVL